MFFAQLRLHGFHVDPDAGLVGVRGCMVTFAGSRMSIDDGTARERFTSARLATLGPLGLAFRKQTGQRFLVIEAVDGSQAIRPLPAKQLDRAMLLMASYNPRAAYTAPPEDSHRHQVATGQQPQALPLPQTPAGWYHDPTGQPGDLRWWDGQHWTDSVHQPGHNS
jgi:Protein of unknown function (DUF2510)